MAPTMMAPTAATFRDPLLRVLATSTNYTVGATVKADTAIRLVCAETGIDENAHGTAKGTGRPRVRIWILQAFNRKLRKEGFADSPRRGHWTLTAKGLYAASLLSGNQPEVVEETETLAPTYAGGGGVSWSLGPQSNTYNPDPYIRGLAVAQTKCFGHFSRRSRVCGACTLSGACKAETINLMSFVASLEAVTDIEALGPEVTEDESLDIDDLLTILLEEQEPAPSAPSAPSAPKYKTCTVPADSKCPICHGKVPMNDTAYYVVGAGVYHPDCFRKKYNVKGKP